MLGDKLYFIVFYNNAVFVLNIKTFIDESKKAKKNINRFFIVYLKKYLFFK